MADLVRPMRVTDVGTVVDVHLEAFSGFFLTFLGPAFLRELYAAIASDLSGITYVYEEDGRVLGFVAGTDQPAGLYGRLLRRRWWRFGLASLGAALRRPVIIPRLLRAFRKPRQAPSASCRGTLMSIAVLPEGQGRGIGTSLAGAFLEESRRRGLGQIDLTTDRLDNNAVNGFYRELGFVCERCYTTPEGREMNEYVVDLAD